MARNSNQKHAVEVAQALTNLNVFASLVAILECGSVYGPTDKSAVRTAKKIIAICKSEQHRQLVIYDRALARLEKAS